MIVIVCQTPEDVELAEALLRLLAANADRPVVPLGLATPQADAAGGDIALTDEDEAAL